jgi:KDO2-lipid IV(A) lauroyltransferase
MFKHASEAEIQHLRALTLSNLGMVIGELPHLHKFSDGKYKNRLNIINGKLITDLQEKNIPIVIIGAHCANWEIMGPVMNRLNIDTFFVYSRFKNSTLNKILSKYRSTYVDNLIEKRDAGKHLVDKLRNKGVICMYVDQRSKNGIFMNFFGENIEKPKSAYTLAYKFNCPIVPVHFQRRKNSNFDIKICSPIYVNKLSSNKQDAITKAAEITNTLFESWIRLDPGAWLCTKRLHKQQF